MIEANENIDEVTMRRQGELRRAQESYQRAVSEGRLDVRLHAAERAQLEVVTSAPLPPLGLSSTAPGELGTAEATTVVVIPQKLPADPEAAWRHTRLVITAGLVVLLLVVWIWQKRAGR